MDRSRLYFLVALLALLLFAGLAGRQGELMLLAAPLLVYLGSAVLLAPQKADLQAERQVKVRMPSSLEQAGPPYGTRQRVVPGGSTVVVRVLVTNTGGSLSEVVVADAGWKHGSSLGTGASSEWEYSFVPTRGRYPFPDLQVLAGDPFGLFASSSQVNAPVDGHPQSSLLVLPGFIPLKHVPVRPPVLRGFAGPVAARTPGSGTDFYGVREYQPGDSLRRLNWRISSRSEGDLFTNQYEGERYADIGLILDARQSRNMIAPGAELFEYSVLVTASLARSFLDSGHRLSLIVYGFSMERVYPGSGRAQGDRILRALAGAKPMLNYALENLGYLPTRLFPPRSQVVFISPLNEDDFEPLVRFRALGYDVLVVSPNPVSFETQHVLNIPEARTVVHPASSKGELSDLESLRLAQRLAVIERELLVRRLGRYGVWVVDWKVERPLVEALRSGLAPVRTGQRMLRI
jgi:uncharacterized protein (DUF58 family)